MGPALRRRQLRYFAVCCVFGSIFGGSLSASAPPAWWRQGRPRRILGSKAEAELLSQLAVLLMPDQPIAEAFRDFPCQKSTEWGANKLCPDLTAHGVLEAADAALFIEYDGYFRHMSQTGLRTDMRKTRALLRFVPKGSVVVRIAHQKREWKDKSSQIVVDCWRPEQPPSLVRTLKQAASSLLRCCSGKLLPKPASRLEGFAGERLDRDARIFAQDAELVGMSNRSSNAKVQQYLQRDLLVTSEQAEKTIARCPQMFRRRLDDHVKPTVEWIKGLGLSQSQVAKIMQRFPHVLGYSIEANLKPTVEWIKGLGLSQSQVAKVIAMSPQLLGLSIEANLKPTVEWIKGLGLSRSQVAKVIQRFPQVLGLSIESNLRPTVEWIKGLGLSRSQVAKVIQRFPPVLGYSIETNLKPTVEWMRGLGLSQLQVANMIATFPAVLGCSIEANLKPTIEWIKELGLSQSQVAKVIVGRPQMLGYSIEANLKPTVEWIKGLGLSQSQVAKVIQRFPHVLGYSIETNLKPTVQWIRGLGLSQLQIARAITSFPPVLGMSIEANLKLKHCLLQKYFAGGKAEALLAQAPRLWSYRFTRLQHRLGVLKSQGQLSKLAGAMTMPLDAFNRRFPNPGSRKDRACDEK